MARSLPALIAAAALLLAAAGRADAHSLVRKDGTELAYLSSDAVSLNTLSVKRSGANIEFRDPTVEGGLDPGPCAPGEITDDANAWLIQVLLPGGGRQPRADRPRRPRGLGDDRHGRPPARACSAAPARTS